MVHVVVQALHTITQVEVNSFKDVSRVTTTQEKNICWLLRGETLGKTHGWPCFQCDRKKEFSATEVGEAMGEC